MCDYVPDRSDRNLTTRTRRSLSFVQMWSGLAAVLCLLVLASPISARRSPRPAPGGGGSAHQTLVFEDDFQELDMQRWQHEITAGGGGNWEFQW
jgi:hypothetical protein